MKQLIWFSVPGAIFMAAWALVGMPNVLALDSKLQIALTLPIGFSIHQFFRTLFERIYGWQLPSRKVIGELQTRYKTENRKRAFIVWEMTLYSNKTENNGVEFPESFRQHNRDSWHYVLSLWSCALISILCSLGVYLPVWVLHHKLDLRWSLFSFCMLGMACIFWRKGDLTYDAINEQEVAALRLYQGAFDRIATRLGYKIVEVPETSVTPRSKLLGLFLGFLKL